MCTAIVDPLTDVFNDFFDTLKSLTESPYPVDRKCLDQMGYDAQARGELELESAVEKVQRRYLPCLEMLKSLSKGLGRVYIESSDSRRRIEEANRLVQQHYPNWNESSEEVQTETIQDIATSTLRPVDMRTVNLNTYLDYWKIIGALLVCPQMQTLESTVKMNTELKSNVRELLLKAWQDFRTRAEVDEHETLEQRVDDPHYTES